MRPLPRSIAGATLATAFAAAAAAASMAHAQQPPLHRTIDDPALQWSPCPEFMPEGCRIASLHGDPAAANADIVFKVPGGARIPRHWHSSAERMVLVAGELEVGYDGHPAVTLQPQEYAYGPARLPHSAHCRSANPCVLFIAFESPVDAHAGAPAE